MHVPPRRVSLLAALACLLAALALALPPLLTAPPSFLGDPRSDVWKHVWGHWWLAERLSERVGWPIHTTLLNYPWGGTLFVIDPCNALVSVLLRPFLPLYARFDVIVIGQMALGAWAAWRLACAVTGDAAASAVAGAIFGFSPWMLSYSVGSGVAETLGIGWIPLAGLAVMRAAADPGADSAVLAGVALILAGLNSWYYLVYAGLLCLLILVGMRLESSGLPRLAPRAGRHLALAALICAVTLTPLAARFLASIQGSGSLGPRDRIAFTTSQGYYQSFFHIADFFVPGKPRLEVTRVVDRLARTPYLGWVGLLLGAAALRRRTPGSRLWAAGAGIFFVLSLGPRVWLADGLQSGAPVNLLYDAARPLLGFSVTSAPYRIHVLTLLCLGMLAAMGMTRWTLRLPTLGAVAAGLALAETCWLSPAPFPLPTAPARIPPIYDGLALQGRAGVLDLPPIRFDSQLVPGEYYYYQVAHGGGIPYLVGGIFDRRVARNPFFRHAWRLAAGVPENGQDPLADGRGLEMLAEAGYRCVVLHADSLPPAQGAAAAALLARWLGKPEARVGRSLRFALRSTRSGRARPP